MHLKGVLPAPSYQNTPLPPRREGFQGGDMRCFRPQHRSVRSGFFFFSQSGFVPRSFPRLAMVALLLLLLLVSCSVAETPLTEPADIAAKAERMREGAPKTPEELLRMLKNFMEHEPTDPLQFMERLSGTASEEWATENGCDWGQRGAWRPPVIYGGGGLGKVMRIPTPYQVNFYFPDNTFFSKLGMVSVIRLDKMFRLTPQMTRNILGAPATADVKLPCPYGDDVCHGDFFVLYYHYYFGKFEVTLKYPTVGAPSKPIHPNEAYQPAMLSEVHSTRRALVEFESHKDFAAEGISVSPLRIR
ncbi:MAG: hypothetical protein ACOY3Z_01385 [Thermodesulfobacteriota bacterium]